VNETRFFRRPGTFTRLRRPNLKSKMPRWRPRRPKWKVAARFRRMKTVFFETLSPSPTRKRPGESASGPEKRQPIGFLVADTFDLPVYVGTTYLAKTNEGMAAHHELRQARNAKAKIHCSLNAGSMSWESDGKIDNIYHGKTFNFEGIRFILVSFSSELWGDATGELDDV